MLPRRVIALVALCCALINAAFGYSLTGTRWSSSSATFQLQLGLSSTPLTDGFHSWGASAEDALAKWNANIANFRFVVNRDSLAAKAQGNRLNNVHFSDSIYGEAWGSGVLAVTITYSAGASQTESDVLFNNRLQWDSYRGALRRDSAGRSVYDFHRVAMHEFGHALGLDHPDEAGQFVSALMNSHISTLDTLTIDDIAGAQSLYGLAVDPGTTLPVITTQPFSRTVVAGQSTSFVVVATAAPPVSYQWRKDGVNIPSAGASAYTIPAVTTAHSGTYTVAVTNNAGTVVSTPATLAVTPATATPTTPTTPTSPTAPTSPTNPTTPTTPTNPTTPTPSVVLPPVITLQPVDRAISVGASFALSVAATGSGLSYQWIKDGAAIGGATTASYTVVSATPVHAGTYFVNVTNSSGTLASSIARVSVGELPVFATQPTNQTVAAGSRLALSVAASGTPTPTIQWFKAGAAISGATAATYTVASAQAPDSGVYHATATNAFGTRTSTSATVTVQALPRIADAPLSQTVNAGARVQLSVTAAAMTPAPTFQWLRDGAEIAGATAATYVLATARATDTGSYIVRVTNAAGSVLSTPAVLTVRFSRLVNLSTRAFVPPGGSLTPGFVIRGAGTKPLIIRAVGPTLAAFGVGSALGGTQLDLISQSNAATVASNNEWGGSSALQNAFARVGAFPLGAGSKDAAVQTALAPNGYTVRIAGLDAEMAGVTLAEIYDDDMSASSPELINLSTLGFVGSGENALTAGFVISGTAQKRVLIRAIGPGLASFGVSGALPNPQLGLVPQGAVEPLAANDDWADVPDLHTAFRNAGAFPLTVGSRDSALVITLNPGAYTVVISSVDGISTGTALVEIYDLDP